MAHRRRAVLAGATVALTVVAMPGAALAADANPRLFGISTPLDSIVASLPVVSSLPLVGGTTTGVTDVASLTSLLDVLTAPVASGGLPGAGALPIPGLGALPIPGVGSAGAGSDPLAALTALIPGLNALTAGLPAGGLPAGQVPTGASLAPATALLRQLAAAAAGTPLASALTSLADQIDAAGAGGVSPDLLGVLAATLTSAANTPGVPAPVADAAKQVATALKPAAGSTTTPPATTTPTKPVTLVPAPTSSSPAPVTAAPTAKPVGKARITSVRVDRKHGRVRVAMACPASGPTCKSIVSAARGSALGTSTILMTVGAGKTSARNLKLTSASRKAIKKRTTKFTVAAIRPGGSLSRRTATTRVPKKHKSHKSHR